MPVIVIAPHEQGFRKNGVEHAGKSAARAAKLIW